jgi:UDP-3-O-[3-hydroxymyristoyl] glucosamine N-acyltransferase
MDYPYPLEQTPRVINPHEWRAPIQNLKLSMVAEWLGGELIGPDKPVEYLGIISALEPENAHLLTPIAKAKFWKPFLASTKTMGLMPQSVLAQVGEVPSDVSLVVTPHEGDLGFFELHQKLYDDKWYPAQEEHYIDPTADIHPTAVIESPCYIGPHCVIEPNCVVYANSYLKSHVRLKAGAIVGGWSLQMNNSDMVQRITPHARWCVPGLACVHRELFRP